MTMISTTMGKNSLEEMEKSESEVAQSCPTLCDPMDCSLLHPWDFPGKNTGVDCHFLLQEIFLTQGLNPGVLHCRQTLYPLSHQGILQVEEYILWNIGLTIYLKQSHILVAMKACGTIRLVQK